MRSGGGGELEIDNHVRNFQCAWRYLAAVTAIVATCSWIALAQNTDAHSARVHRHQGVTYLDQGDLVRALDEFRSAVRLDPADAASHDGLGIALVQSGRAEQAVTEFQAAIALEDSFAAAHFHLGLAYDGLEIQVGGR